MSRYKTVETTVEVYLDDFTDADIIEEMKIRKIGIANLTRNEAIYLRELLDAARFTNPRHPPAVNFHDLDYKLVKVISEQDL